MASLRGARDSGHGGGWRWKVGMMRRGGGSGAASRTEILSVEMFLDHGRISPLLANMLFHVPGLVHRRNDGSMPVPS